jgi:plasmid rolling circle replication initiator protein Rep
MDFSNETLIEMQRSKFEQNKRFANLYSEMSNEFSGTLPSYSETLFKKGERISSCLNFWEWDVYHKNKLMDLIQVNRCHNNRFCPTCRKWDLSGAMHNLSKPFNKLLSEGYFPYLATLTVVNVPGEDLRRTIDKMNKSFRKLFGALNYSLDGTTKGFKERYISIAAALKSLEITYNEDVNTYHPHFHCLFFSAEYDESIFIKDIPGEWSSKRRSYNFYSLMDIQLMKLWTMCFENIRLTYNNYEKLQPEELLTCDIREMDSAGIAEVMKYTFKDTDILNYEVFKNIEIALESKRIRQGYGLLYNVKLEGDADGEKLYLSDFLLEEEKPETLYTWEIDQLVSKRFKEYRKISRTKAHEGIAEIK